MQIFSKIKIFKNHLFLYFMKKFIIIFALFFLFSCGNSAPKMNSEWQPITPYEIGSVDTAFKLLGPDHKIEIGAVPDPKISGITCFYSRAKTGGISGGIGIAEDTSDASVACRQTGEISFKEAISSSEEIWNESSSILFKKIRIVRMYDKYSNSLIYLVYSDKLVDGSPKNSISAVALEGVSAVLK